MKKFNFIGKFIKTQQYWVCLMLALVFFFGLAARFYDFDDPPLDFHPTRQLRSMLIARGMYYENRDDVSQERRNLAVLQWKSEGQQIEPPIMERLTAWGYQLVGTDDLRVPRFLAIFFWTAGGVGLFLLLRYVVGAKGAIAGVAYYMLLPFPLFASRSFQPEPLMTAAIIFSWWSIVRWAKHKTWTNAVLAGLITGFAIYVKLPAIFFVAPAMITIAFWDQKLFTAIRQPQVITMGILAILPALIYHVDGLYISGFLQNQTIFRLFPNMLTNPLHYFKWIYRIGGTLGIEFFLLGMAGTLLIQDKKFRIMVISIFIGYFLYGLVFAYHIVTHTYYQIPLTPLIAIGLSAFAAAVIKLVVGRKSFGMIVVGALLFSWMAYNFWDIRTTLENANYRQEPEFYADLGEKLWDYSVVSITPDYGYRLLYWGWKNTINWMSSGDFNMRELAGMEIDKADLFAEAVAGREFFLVTSFSELDRQPDVREILYNTYPIYDQGEDYLIFDLRETQ